MFSDESDEKRVVFIIVIVVLAVTVVVLLIITAYFIIYLKPLKHQQNESKVETLKMRNASNESGLNSKSQDTSPTKATNEYDIAPDDENAHYTALNRNGNEDEEDDHYYSGLREAPLYVNASEFKSSA